MKTTTMRTNVLTTAPTVIPIIAEATPLLSSKLYTNGALAVDVTDLRELKLELKVQEHNAKPVEFEFEFPGLLADNPTYM
jgi:hypothetical protein